MTPEKFVEKWKAVELKERSASQSHFIDLCGVLGELAPTDADPKGDWYAFERGASKTTGGDGWADVWKRGHFGWEYKGKRKDLTAAFAQLQQYALALENPPLLIVCDMDRFQIHTNWTNSISEVHEFGLEDLTDPSVRQKLKWAFADPEKLKPGKTRQALTEEAAAEFSILAQRLRGRGFEPQAVAHFINRLVFCMFAEDVDLLPNNMFKRMLEHSKEEPSEFQSSASNLFGAMNVRGGRVGFERVAWFNGGLFNDDAALPLGREDIEIILRAAELDWSEVDPSILGTLFERGLDPDKRSQLGAHYTDRDKIMQIVTPVIVEPWLDEWEVSKIEIAGHMAKVNEARERRPSSQSEARKVHAVARRTEEVAYKSAVAAYFKFLERLKGFRILDPACGSGNFLYLALTALKNIEHRANIEAELLGMARQAPAVGPECVLGIEVNQYAAELARVSVWVGEIQWMRRNGFDVSRDPILKPLDTIQCRDALLNEDGSVSEWPIADVIIGNPPFLGDKKFVGVLGAQYVKTLRSAYAGRLGGNVDLVCYWFEKAGRLLATNPAMRGGLVATNSIRRGANRSVLDGIRNAGEIFEAWSDEKWVLDGAAVRVSLICFGPKRVRDHKLDGKIVSEIYADLTSGSSDVTKAAKLPENSGISFFGVQKSGPLEISGEVARKWIALPLNPNGRPNSDVLRPYWNGDDVTSRPRDYWLIDLPRGKSENEVALFEAPFEFLSSALYQPDKPDDVRTLREARAGARDKHASERWWEPYWPRPEMRAKIDQLERYIVAPLTPTYTLFAWLSRGIVPDNNLIVITKDDDVTFGILHSRFHRLWVHALGSPYGNHPTARRYNNSRVFETYPFPEGLTPNISPESYATDPRAIAVATSAARLNSLRENWINPHDLVESVPEVISTLPNRVVPRDERSGAQLRKRTLTSLYNDRPTWLENAHKDLDEAVAIAYGWAADISDDDAMACLFSLNQSRSSEHNKRQSLPGI